MKKKFLFVSNCLRENSDNTVLSEIQRKQVCENLQHGCRYFIQPIIIAIQLYNCWKIADLISDCILGDRRHRRDGSNNKLFSPEQIRDIVMESGCDIVVIVFHYKKKEEFLELLRILNITSKEVFNLVEKMDMSMNLLLVDNKNNNHKLI